MHVRANLCEWRVWVGVRDVLAFEKLDMTISAMDVFLYVPDPEEWVKSAV